jgi:hypothetical protein
MTSRTVNEKSRNVRKFLIDNHPVSVSPMRVEPAMIRSREPALNQNGKRVCDREAVEYADTDYKNGSRK